MSSPSDDQRFLELLQRWQSGDFTRQDELVLRNLSESDDFRREAMEGFMAMPEADHSERIAALRKRLQTARPRTRVLLIPQMMAIAAALLVLVAAIWFFPRSTEKAAAPVAQMQDPAPAPIDTAPSLTSTEMTTSGDAAQAAPETRRDAVTMPRSQAAKPQAKKDFRTADDQQIMSAEAKEEATVPPLEQAPSATLALPPRTTGPPGADARTAGKAKAAPITAAPITADTTALAWNETEKKSNVDKLKREVRAEKAGPLQSEPAEGWAAFNEYLRQNARLPADARDHNVSGTVRLRFTVNANGDPQNFVILRSLGYGCEEEAKRLVQNWPWIRGQQPEVTVEVKFIR